MVFTAVSITDYPPEGRGRAMRVLVVRIDVIENLAVILKVSTGSTLVFCKRFSLNSTPAKLFSKLPLILCEVLSSRKRGCEV